MDYIHFCRSYFNVTHIPVSLLENSVPVYSSISEALSIPLEKNFLYFLPLEIRKSVFSRQTSNMDISKLKILILILSSVLFLTCRFLTN